MMIALTTNEASLRFKEALGICPLVAILRWITPTDVEAVAAAILDEGFSILEIPLNSPNALKSIELVSRRFQSSAVIGAGTVMTPSQVAQVQLSGGTLIVMPHADTQVVETANNSEMACVPGVATPTEGFAALRAGATGLKLFPAEAMSPSVLRAWRAVFTDDIALLPTGGITPESMATWIKSGATGFGIGGRLYMPGSTVREVRENARSFVKAWRSAKQ